MAVVGKLKGKVQKVIDTIFPIEYEDYALIDEEEVQAREGKTERSAAEREAADGYRGEVKASGGSSPYVDRADPVTESSAASSYGRQGEPRSSQQKLTVHTANRESFRVQIYAPADFDQVTAIADDIRSGKACVVNYEKIDKAEQCRICDFVNGVCYVMKGGVTRISDEIVLYVPAGIKVTDAMSLTFSR